jgi:hypothetical protein
VKRFVIPLAIAAMLALLGAAVAWDCVRLAADAAHRVALADHELEKHELRLVKLLSASSKTSSESRAAIAAHGQASDAITRHVAYDELVAIFRKTSDAIDPTNPLDRKFMDDVAGAINRRQIAEKPYDDEQAAYGEFLSSFRGRIARLFSPRARADWKQM